MAVKVNIEKTKFEKEWGAVEATTRLRTSDIGVPVTWSPAAGATSQGLNDDCVSERADSNKQTSQLICLASMYHLSSPHTRILNLN